VGSDGVTDGDVRRFARDARQEIDDARPRGAAASVEAPAALAEGDRVEIVDLGAKGEVVAVKGDRITVQIGLAKTTVARQRLRSLGEGPPARRAEGHAVPSLSPPSASSRHFGADAEPVEARFDNVVDLRGTRADEALTMVEVFLSRAIEDDVEVVIVRHGHGSGALRKVVREHLPRLAHAHRHRPGLPAEGGDAVTVVWVKG
jgi:DNA mismatch repair protein MutS2